MTEPTPELRLGWKHGPADPRTLNMASYKTPDLPAPPTSLDFMAKVEKWPILGNNRYGDCVFVTTAHLMQAWSTYAGAEKPFQPTTDQVLAAYSAVTGFDPRTGRGDNGTVTLDALNFWRKHGIAGRKVSAFVKLDHRNQAEVKTALHLFAGVFLAAQLPTSAEAQFNRRQPWTVARAGGGVGSWGGHAIRLGAYDTDGITVSTWGRPQHASWDWWKKYGAEAWAVLSPDQFNSAGLSTLGFDLGKLRDDLANITKL